MRPYIAMICAGVVGGAVIVGLVLVKPRPTRLGKVQNVMNTYSVADRVAQFGDDAKARWVPFFDAAGLDYPPARLTFIGIKDQKQLEIWAAAEDGVYRHLRTCPVLGSSGGPGPKLREGDRQVPEGLYTIESLNPNSRFHLSLRINYPNAHDKARAREEGRTNLGGDIMIHGSTASIGCLAMGDEVAEDLFILAALTDYTKVDVILTPTDFRLEDSMTAPPASPAWVGALYEKVREAMIRFK